MNMQNICKELQEKLGELFIYDNIGEYLRITTPYLYPDCDCIDLFCKDGDEEGEYIVTDLSETSRWLRVQSGGRKRSPKERQLIENICQTRGVEFSRGMIYARCSRDGPLAEVVTRVAQAALRVSDLWFITRVRLMEVEMGQDANVQPAATNPRDWWLEAA